MIPIGLVGGTVWHFFGGLRNAPKGQRIAQTVARVRTRVPITGGSFAVWGVLFSCCDCTFTYIRRKEDPWNAIISGAATGGILAARAGVKAAGRSAVVGGLILAAIEGLNLLLVRVLMPKMEKMNAEAGLPAPPVDTLEPPVDPRRPRSRIPRSQKPLFEANPSPSPLFTPSFGTSSGSGSSSSWDTPGFTTESNFSSDRTNLGTEEEKKSSWKFW